MNHFILHRAPPTVATRSFLHGPGGFAPSFLVRTERRELAIRLPFHRQLWLFSRKQWPALPFHPEDVEKARVGEVLRITRT